MILTLAACLTAPAVEPAFLKLRGAVPPEIVLEGDDAMLFATWVTSVDGDLCVETEELALVARLQGYEVDIPGPPEDVGATCVPAPPSLPDEALAFGLLVLADPDPDAAFALGVDPSALLGWFAGEPGSVGDALRATGGRVAATASGFALIVAAGPVVFEPSYCRFDAVVSGLTLYEDRSEQCEGWAPVAAAGERTEVQGVDLVAP